MSSILAAGAKTISTAFAVLMVFVFSTNRTPPFALAKGQFALNAPRLKQGIGANGVLILAADPVCIIHYSLFIINLSQATTYIISHFTQYVKTKFKKIKLKDLRGCLKGIPQATDKPCL